MQKSRLLKRNFFHQFFARWTLREARQIKQVSFFLLKLQNVKRLILLHLLIIVTSISDEKKKNCIFKSFTWEKSSKGQERFFLFKASLRSYWHFFRSFPSAYSVFKKVHPHLPSLLPTPTSRTHWENHLDDVNHAFAWQQQNKTKTSLQSKQLRRVFPLLSQSILYILLQVIQLFLSSGVWGRESPVRLARHALMSSCCCCCRPVWAACECRYGDAQQSCSVKMRWKKGGM